MPCYECGNVEKDELADTIRENESEKKLKPGSEELKQLASCQLNVAVPFDLSGQNGFQFSLGFRLKRR